MILNSCSCKNYLQGSQSPTSTLSPEATTQQVMLVRNRIFYSLHTRSMVVKWAKVCLHKSFLSLEGRWGDWGQCDWERRPPIRLYAVGSVHCTTLCRECVLLSVKMQVMNNNGVDKEEEKGGLTLEQFTDIVLAQVIFDIWVIFDIYLRLAQVRTNICSRATKRNRGYD